jgi:hypothetical protein
MAGIQDFTYANYGKETVRGTPVAPTRKWYGESTGVLGEDLGLHFHEGENRGIRAPIVRATQQTEDVSLKLRDAAGVGFDDLVLWLTQLKGGQTGAGGAADKTWAPTGIGGSAVMNQEAFSFDVGDDVQNWRVQYCMMKSWKLSAGLGDVTHFEAELFGQRALKVAKATPGDTTSPKIVGDLWTIKYAATAAGLAGASVQTNHLLDFELSGETGLVWEHFMDGNLYGSQHQETSTPMKLRTTVQSTALAVTEYYDKWKAQTVDFIRLKNTSPVVLGGSFYSLQLDMPVIYSNVEVIGSESDGVNEYSMEANLAYDTTLAAMLAPTLVCSLAAIP